MSFSFFNSELSQSATRLGNFFLEGVWEKIRRSLGLNRRILAISMLEHLGMVPHEGHGLAKVSMLLDVRRFGGGEEEAADPPLH